MEQKKPGAACVIYSSTPNVRGHTLHIHVHSHIVIRGPTAWISSAADKAAEWCYLFDRIKNCSPFSSFFFLPPKRR